MASLTKDQKRRISKGISRGIWGEREARKYAKGGVEVNKINAKSRALMAKVDSTRKDVMR